MLNSYITARLPSENVTIMSLFVEDFLNFCHIYEVLKELDEVFALFHAFAPEVGKTRRRTLDGSLLVHFQIFVFIVLLVLSPRSLLQAPLLQTIYSYSLFIKSADKLVPAQPVPSPQHQTSQLITSSSFYVDFTIQLTST